MTDPLLTEAMQRFDDLLQRARASGDPEPTAMSVASVSLDGLPSSRAVLLKAHDARGFVFYTNLHSRKGRELQARPVAALLFHWKQIDNGVQVRIEGTTEVVTDAEADAYFATRPRPSQIGAWASLQSDTLSTTEEFDRRITEVEARFADSEVSRPPHWSGFRVVPERIEFWFGAEFRLHERQYYERGPAGWTRRMLYP